MDNPFKTMVDALLLYRNFKAFRLIAVGNLFCSPKIAPIDGYYGYNNLRIWAYAREKTNE